MTSQLILRARERAAKLTKPGEQTYDGSRDADLLLSLALALEEATGKRDEHFAELKCAQFIIDGLKQYREMLVTFRSQTTSDMRDRIYELSEQTTEFGDDYDRAVRMLLSDFRGLSALAANALPSPPNSQEG